MARPGRGRQGRQAGRHPVCFFIVKEVGGGSRVLRAYMVLGLWKTKGSRASSFMLFPSLPSVATPFFPPASSSPMMRSPSVLPCRSTSPKPTGQLWASASPHTSLSPPGPASRPWWRPRATRTALGGCSGEGCRAKRRGRRGRRSWSGASWRRRRLRCRWVNGRAGPVGAGKGNRRLENQRAL
jgi:hypothetical protein